MLGPFFILGKKLFFFLLTNESYLPLQKLNGLNEKLFEFDIQAKKDFEIKKKEGH